MVKGMNIKEKAVGLLMVAAICGVLMWIGIDYRKKIETGEKQFMNEESNRFSSTKIRMEQAFRIMYQNTRTISLLPSIRAIEGANLKAGETSAVDNGRFSQESKDTIQQLYNNLASNVPVSEVYCVIDGFDPKKGETPFFMYDELILEAQQNGEESDEANHSDFPEELEDEEYAWFVKNIPIIKKKYPEFGYKTLDEIPGFFSTELRTCDNTQYTSKHQGNEEDSHGIILSVPFYDTSDRFKGLISVIFRSNILEAMLLNRPFIPIAKGEIEQAAREGWQLPPVGRFLLANKALNLMSYDRRNTDVVATYRSVIEQRVDEGRLPLHMAASLKLSFSNDWELFYLLDQDKISDYRETVMRNAIARGFLVSMIGGLLLVGIYKKSKNRLKRQMITEQLGTIADSGGDLTRRLTANDSDEMGVLAKRFNLFMENLHGIITQIKEVTQTLTSTAVGLSGISAEMSSGADQTSSKSHTVANATEEMSSNMKSIAAAMEQTSTNIEIVTSSAEQLTASINEIAGNSEKARAVTTEAAKKAKHSSEKMEGLGSAAQEITKVTETITEISEQTNLLALNATIEAARAGEAGKGFAVVANEIKELARQTAEATGEIRKRIEGMQNATIQAIEGIEEIPEIIRNVDELVSTIATAVEEQSLTTKEIAENVGQASKGINEVSMNVSQNSSVSEEIAKEIAEVN